MKAENQEKRQKFIKALPGKFSKPSREQNFGREKKRKNIHERRQEKKLPVYEIKVIRQPVRKNSFRELKISRKGRRVSDYVAFRLARQAKLIPNAIHVRGREKIADEKIIPKSPRKINQDGGKKK